MKPTILNFFCLMVLCLQNIYSQAKKPTIMIVPSDVYCNLGGYMIGLDNQGTYIKVPDYKKAMQESLTLVNTISKINGMMAERGFPLKNLASVLKDLEKQSAEDALMDSKEGAKINESPIDKIRKVAKADIIIELTMSLNTVGPKKSITYNLQGIDSYTSKQVATAQGTGASSFSSSIPELVEEAVVAHMDNFTSTLQNHFDDMFENGREITIRIKTFSDWEYDLEEEFDGDELSFIIEDWMDENALKGRYNTTDATENIMLLEQVRIPLYNDRGKAMDAKRFVRKLSKYLKSDPFKITNKIVTQGLGQATLILGSK